MTKGAIGIEEMDLLFMDQYLGILKMIEAQSG